MCLGVECGRVRGLLFTSAGNCTKLAVGRTRPQILQPASGQRQHHCIEALQRIGKVYAVEDEGKHLTIETRQILRAGKSLPILQSLHELVTANPLSYRRRRRHRQSHGLHLEALAKPDPLRRQRTPDRQQPHRKHD